MLLTVKEAANRLRLSPGEVYKLCDQRKLLHLRLGTGRGVIRIHEQDLDDFMRAATVQPDEPTTPQPPRARLKHLKA